MRYVFGVKRHAYNMPFFNGLIYFGVAINPHKLSPLAIF